MSTAVVFKGLIDHQFNQFPEIISAHLNTAKSVLFQVYTLCKTALQIVIIFHYCVCLYIATGHIPLSKWLNCLADTIYSKRVIFYEQILGHNDNFIQNIWKLHCDKQLKILWGKKMFIILSNFSTQYILYQNSLLCRMSKINNYW